MIEHDGSGGCLVHLKVVPGASRTRVVGALGDRLKVAVAAPPEAGKANASVLALLADALGVRPACVSLHAGPGTTMKTVRVVGLTPEQARAALGP